MCKSLGGRSTYRGIREARSLIVNRVSLEDSGPSLMPCRATMTSVSQKSIPERSGMDDESVENRASLLVNAPPG